MEITRRSIKIDIFQGEDQAKLADLHQSAEYARLQYERGKANANARGGDAPASPQAAEDAYDAFLTEATDRAVTVVAQDIGRKRWRQLKAEHKGRRENRVIDGTPSSVYVEDDEEFELNTDTFPDALLTFADDATGVRTIVSPEFGTKAALQEWLDNLPDGEFERLWQTAYYLNTTAGADPKSSRYSEVPRS